MSPGVTAVEGPVLIVGAGLIGTSIAMALDRAQVEVVLADTNAGHLELASAAAHARAAREDESPSLVVVAVPPSRAAQVLAEASERYPNATLTDVTSVKGSVLTDAVTRGADPRRLVGGHPLAGREVSGPSGARNFVFDDRIWVITPTEQTADEHAGRVRRLIATVGAYPMEMSPDAHDEAVALTSHGPQLLSSALAAQLALVDASMVRVSGGGLRDMTRIAGSDPQLWSDILTANAAPVAQVLDAIAHELQGAASALRAGDRDAVLDIIARGNTGSDAVPGKHGGAAARFAVIPVMITDRPGELAKLFAASDDVGVSIEDVRIEHVLGRPSGLVELSVQPDVSDRLAEVLRHRGFDVRS